jgi:hypothetical protein
MGSLAQRDVHNDAIDLDHKYLQYTVTPTPQPIPFTHPANAFVSPFLH